VPADQQRCRMTNKIPVKPDPPLVSPECADVRPLLEDFASRRLGPLATGTVQGHLLTCDACADALGMLFVDKVERGELPLLESPHLPLPVAPPVNSQMRRSVLSWRALLDVMVDPQARDWAATRLEEIRIGLASFGPAVGPLRTRGAETPASKTATQLVARVSTGDGEPAAASATFRVLTPAAITADGRFEFRLVTEQLDYAGRRVRCSIALSDDTVVVFDAPIVQHAGESVATVTFDERDLPARNCAIPPGRLTLTIV
jgi:hypothetical protein